MTRQEFISSHWNYYRYLEENFIESQKFVFLDKLNYKTFSLNYVHQLLSICSEFEAVLKTITKHVEHENQKHYSVYKLFNNYLTNLKIKNIEATEITVLLNPSLIVKPFEYVFNNSTLSDSNWWTSYNKVKHNRLNNLEYANLKNTLYSLSALYYLNISCIRYIAQENERDIPDESSKIFLAKNFTVRYIPASEVFFHSC